MLKKKTKGMMIAFLFCKIWAANINNFDVAHYNSYGSVSVDCLKPIEKENKIIFEDECYISKLDYKEGILKDYKTLEKDIKDFFIAQIFNYYHFIEIINKKLEVIFKKKIALPTKKEDFTDEHTVKKANSFEGIKKADDFLDLIIKIEKENINEQKYDIKTQEVNIKEDSISQTSFDHCKIVILRFKHINCHRLIIFYGNSMKDIQKSFESKKNILNSIYTVIFSRMDSKLILECLKEAFDSDSIGYACSVYTSLTTFCIPVSCMLLQNETFFRKFIDMLESNFPYFENNFKKIKHSK